MRAGIVLLKPQPESTSVSRRSFIATCSAACLSAGFIDTVALGQDDPEASSSASLLNFEEQPITHWRIGLVLTTPVTCYNAYATFPIPTDWPEQNVTIRRQNIDPKVTAWKVRELPGGTKQVLVQMARVPAGSTTEISFEFDISRSRTLPPGPTDHLVIPKKIPRELKLYTGNSPFIDASHRAIRAATQEIAAIPADNAWKRVETIYDYVRENVDYIEGELKNASQALTDGTGDCEEMTSLFVAICRNMDIPARVVWIPDHCYPEFYLETPDGQGTWFPCQAAGTKQFGRMDEVRPVLQKGDRFKIPEQKKPVRYVSEYFRCDRKGKGQPKPNFIREPFDL